MARGGGKGMNSEVPGEASGCSVLAMDEWGGQMGYPWPGVFEVFGVLGFMGVWRLSHYPIMGDSLV